MKIFAICICVYLFIGLIYIGYCIFVEHFIDMMDDFENLRTIKQSSKILWYVVALIACSVMSLLWPYGACLIVKDAIRNRKLK